jgi:hypothetical protein
MGIICFTVYEGIKLYMQHKYMQRPEDETSIPCWRLLAPTTASYLLGEHLCRSLVRELD